MRAMRIGWMLAAVIAVAGVCGPARAGAERQGVTGSVRVTVVTDQGRVSGELVGWDDGGAWIETREDGEVRAQWADFGSKRAYDVRRRLIDLEDWRGWARIGVLMLEMGDGRQAERAFATAERKSKEAARVIREVRATHERGGDLYAVLDGASEAEETDTGERIREREGEGSPTEDGGRSGPDDREAVQGVRPWKTLSAAEHERATTRLRRVAQGMLMIGDFEIEPVQTKHFLLYSDLPASETRKWAGQLDRMYETLLRTLDIPEGTKLFNGKCVVFIFAEREDFIGFETSVWQNSGAQWMGGVCHQRGEDVFICFFKGGKPDQDFQSILIHEAVHGFIYRYRSPARLPTWANEGLADYVAGYLTERSAEPQRHWQHARNFVMSGKDPATIMAQRYGGTGALKWPNDDSYPVSHMIVRFMLKHRASAFKQWIDDIKAGRQWEESMRARFGVDSGVLAEGFAEEMRSETRFTRLR